MNLLDFRSELAAISCDVELQDFCQRTVIHGMPFAFHSREEELFKFKKRICQQFNIHHTEVFIVGSAKLGFSPHKGTEFSLDSDIDVAIVSENLWENVYCSAAELEHSMRTSMISLHSHQYSSYVKFLRYCAIGWMRPDKIPNVAPMKKFKQDWFDFFGSISHGRSEVGNYKVSAGVFRSQQHLETYTIRALENVRNSIRVDQAA
ncbi:hypothetical protein [Planktotalea sp.]|uniref:hypothetical protein n=1 Tax=Planktotalea sp. TaxID=2029877 RepID=UPI00329A519A